MRGSQAGSVTFIQRFGSALNLNIHFHTLFADGVFCRDKDSYDFHRLPAPIREELFALTSQIRHQVLKIIKKFEEEDSTQLSFDEEALGELTGLSIRHKSGFGRSAGRQLGRHGSAAEIETEAFDDPYSVNMDGFSLNARVSVTGHDRKKLEQVIRYMSRGPVASGRLTESHSDTLKYELKTPWRDGTTHINFSPMDFIARLVALIPPPRMNLVRYHGVFAPNFRDRKLIVLKSPNPSKESKADPSSHPESEPSQTSDTSDKKTEREKRSHHDRLLWSEVLKRTFKIDVTVCPKCQGRLEQIAVIKDTVVAKAILASLNQSTIFKPRNIEAERGPPHSAWPCFEDFDQSYSW